jgi:hypothetical protein
MIDNFTDTTPGKRDCGIIRTDLVRRMLNPLDEYPDLFDRLTTSAYRNLQNRSVDEPPQVAHSMSLWGVA